MQIVLLEVYLDDMPPTNSWRLWREHVPLLIQMQNLGRPLVGQLKSR